MNPGSVIICTYSHQIRPFHQLKGYSMARDETMSLFHLPDEEVGPVQSNAPLAERMRPRTLDEFVGQEHLDVHFATCSSVLIDLDYSGSLWERGSSCTKITLGPQERGCSPCRCLSRTLFVCPIHSVPNLRP